MQALATAVRPDTSLLPAVTTGVAARLEALLDEEEHRWSSLDADLAGAVNLLRDHVLAGGKRLRSAFCRWGHAGAGGYPDEPGVLDVAAALELLHAFALLHDDVMDGSATRRGQPALHRALADRHTRLAWRGDPRRFGDGMAILVGDLAFAYADRLLSGLPRDVKSVWDELRIELVMGQYLDMDAAARGGADLVRARRIAVYKSARYTVERPLHLGAALAGRYDEFAPHYSAFGRPLGEAFQLRDDLLGVFGDSAGTGKPVGDDLREGKPTVLLALAHERSSPSAGRVLARVGAPDLRDAEVARLRRLFVDCGARGTVETMIEARLEEALAALDAAPVEHSVRPQLRALALRTVRRDA